MYKFEHKPLEQDEQSLIKLFFLFVLFIFASAFIGGFVGSSIFLMAFDGNLKDAQVVLESIYDYPQYKIHYTLMQGIVSTFMFVIAPWLFLKLVAKKKLSSLNRAGTKFSLLGIGLVIITMVASTPFMSYLYQVNRELNFGEWAKDMATNVERVSNFITDFDSTPHFILGIVIMAMLPAIGEELTFRGVLQNLIFKGSKNIDTSVWAAAILFSAIHMQFDGFFVRMLLAVSFGYIYYWTGSLWYPIFGHFLNNTLALVAIYLAKKNIIEQDPETFGSMGLFAALISLAVTIGLHYVIFRSRSKFQKELNHE